MPESPEQAARRLDEIAPGYLARIRRRAAELSTPKLPAERARRLIDLVAQSAPIDPEPPITGRRPQREMKRVVGRLVRFYFLHVAAQVATLGESTAMMGEALHDYVAGLEAEVAELRDRLVRLEQRPDDS